MRPTYSIGLELLPDSRVRVGRASPIGLKLDSTITLVLQTINIDIYLKFRVFDTIFNYLKYLKKIIRINIYFSTNIVVKICNKISRKLAKYYSRIKKLSNILYNLVNILDFTQEVNLYKL